MERYYIQQKSGEVFGPFEMPFIERLLIERNLVGTEVVSQDGLTWIPILSIPEFSRLMQADGSGSSRRSNERKVPMPPVASRPEKGESMPYPSGPVLPELPRVQGDEQSSTGFDLAGDPFGEGDSGTGFPSPVEDDVGGRGDQDQTAWARPKVAGMEGGGGRDAGRLSDVTLPPLSELPGPPPLSFDLPSIGGLGLQTPPRQVVGEDRQTSAFEELMDVLDRKSGLLKVPASPPRTPGGQPQRPGQGLHPLSARASGGLQFPELPAVKREEEEDYATPHGVRIVLPLPVESVPELPSPKRYGAAEWEPGHYPGTEPGLDRLPGVSRGTGPAEVTIPPATKAGEAELPAVRSEPPDWLEEGLELPVVKDDAHALWLSAVELPGAATRRGEGSELPAVKDDAHASWLGRAEPPDVAPRRAELPELPVPRADAHLPWSPGEVPADELAYRAQSAELPRRKDLGAELPVARATSAELPVKKEGVAELPVRKEGVAELPTVQFGAVGLPARREVIAELPTSRFGGTGLPVTSDASVGGRFGGVKVPDLPAVTYKRGELPEVREGRLVPDTAPEDMRTMPLSLAEIEAAQASARRAPRAVDLVFSEDETAAGPSDLPGDVDRRFPTGESLSIPREGVGFEPTASTLDLSGGLQEGQIDGVSHKEPASTAPRSGIPTEMRTGVSVEEQTATVVLRVGETPSLSAIGLDAKAPERYVAPADRPPGTEGARRPGARIRPGGYRILPYAAVLGLLGLVLVGVMVLPGLFSKDNGEGVEGTSGGEIPVPQLVTRAAVVDFSLLMSGAHGDYTSFLQQATAAVEHTGQRDLNAVARLLVGQALMAVQYGPTANLIVDMENQAGLLAEGTDEIHRLARGAYAASQGEKEEAFSDLSSISTGPHAAWARLFMGLAEIQRFRLAMEVYGAQLHGAATEDALPVQAEEPPQEEGEVAVEPSGATPPGDATAPATEASAPPVTAPPSPGNPPDEERGRGTTPPEPPVMEDDARENLEMAARLAPEMVAAYYFNGVQARLGGHGDQAIAYFEQAIERQPQHLPSILERAELLVEQGHFAEARSQLGRTLEFPTSQSSERERSAVHLLLGRIALARREVNEALEELKQAFYADPSNPAAVRELGELFFDAGKYEEGVEFFQPHAASGSTNAELLIALARNRLGQGRTAADPTVLGALAADLERTQGSFPSDPRFPYYLGRVSQAMDQFDEAEASYRAAIERDPDFGPGYLSLSELARISNENETAISYLHEAITRGANDANLEQQIGEAYLLMDQPQLAIQAFRRAIELDPYSIEAHIQIARQQIEVGGQDQLTEALQHLRTVESTGVELPEIHALFAQVHYGLGDLNQARDRMQRIASNEELRDDPEHLYLLGRIHFDIGELARQSGDEQGASQNFEAAREKFTAAFTAQRDMSPARFWEGRAYLALNELDSAMPSLRNAFEMSVRDGQPSGEYRYWLGQCQQAVGQYQTALESYLLVDRYDLRWALQHPEFYYFRGRILAGMEYLRRAQRDLEWALILRRDYEEATHTLADVFFREQQYTRAVEQWLRSLQIRPDQADVHYRLGTTYIRIGSIEDATRHLERARALDYGQVQPEVFRTLGFLYRDWPQGARTAEAIESFRTYLGSGATNGLPALRIEIENQIRQLGGTL